MCCAVLSNHRTTLDCTGLRRYTMDCGRRDLLLLSLLSLLSVVVVTAVGEMTVSAVVVLVVLAVVVVDLVLFSRNV